MRSKSFPDLDLFGKPSVSQSRVVFFDFFFDFFVIFNDLGQNPLVRPPGASPRELLELQELLELLKPP